VMVKVMKNLKVSFFKLDTEESGAFIFFNYLLFCGIRALQNQILFTSILYENSVHHYLIFTLINV
jgi:hypothetical protein